ncbi:unnamed protein product [Fraxinus pennsylvanica]|uniref:DNA2/NAM7 helicase helicase domain-containing protein n=1 Tax=Fraxinus pennsylvanica TaxID=56036 RepID=A0AAD2DRF7_9LAMI|nr:unnamed protein product [Fraxinus pennsylvanica]
MMGTVEKKKIEGRGLIDVVFSWSIDDVMNKDLYKNKVKPIPETFYTAEHYLRSFNDPLLEETHASLRSSFTPKNRPPAREIFDVNPNKDFKPPKDFFYTMTLKRLRSGSEEDKRVYEPEVGDLIALIDVEPIPETFYSAKHYLRSFNSPLLEETHASLRSSFTPKSHPRAREIFDVNPNKDFRPPKYLFYTMTMKRLSGSEEDKRVYEPVVGDLIALTDVRPEYIEDLNTSKRPYSIAVLYGIKDDDDSTRISVISSKPIMFDMPDMDKLFAFYLTNLTTNIQIWQALHPNLIGENMKIINSVLRVNPSVEENCTICSVEESRSTHESMLREPIGTFGMNDSQEAAILNCIVTKDCHYRNDVKLIWGPPGTGKTKTILSLLFALLRTKCMALTCAPTNVAVIGVATKLLSLLSDTLVNNSYGLGDIVLFGNGERMKIDGNESLFNVLSLLEKFSDGWRQLHKPEILSNMDSAASQLLELYDVKWPLKLI